MSNYVLHKLAHLPANKGTIALKFSTFQSSLCLRNIVNAFVQNVNYGNIENIYHN